MTKGRACWVYRGRKQPEMYLYVSAENDFERVPNELLKRMGTPELALNFELTPDRKLARANAQTVLDALDEKGFYLQMPPAEGTRHSAILGPR